MENKIKEIMSVVLKVSITELDENSSPTTIPNWDSLGHMNLIVALEEEFGVQFDDEDMLNLLNYKLLRLTLEEKLGTNK
jgi:acyl carrier protein